MRKERFLLAVLWALALMLPALWFFNTVFGFNLLAASHWQYLAELQLSGGVNINFYIAIAGFIVTWIVGLYILIVPWHRRIKVRGLRDEIGGGHANTSNLKPQTSNLAHSPQTVAKMDRPPKLNINSSFVVKPPVPAYNHSASFTPPPMSAAAAPAMHSNHIVLSEIREKIKGVLADVGFMNKAAPKVGEERLDFWAIGSDEGLVVGLLSDEFGDITASEGGDSMWHANGRSFKSPAWRMTSIVQKIEALLLETVSPELKINILPFVFSPGVIGNKDTVLPIWDALGVKVFDNHGALAEFMNNHRPRVLDASEDEDYQAFSGFVDTVASYFNGGS